jgi:hypothetical protein
MDKYNFKDFKIHNVTIDNTTHKLYRVLFAKIIAKGSMIAVNSRVGPPRFLEINFSNPMWDDVREFYKDRDIEFIDNRELEPNEAFLYRNIDQDLDMYLRSTSKTELDPNDFVRRIKFSGGIIDKLYNRKERIKKLLDGR